LFGGIELHLRNVGYQMMLVGPNEYAPAPRRGLEGLRQRRFDGMIVLCAASDPGDDAVLSSESEAAIVAIEYTGRTVLPVVEYDQALGVGLAVRHLAGLKHKRLLWVGSRAREGCEEGGERERMFANAARDAGLAVEFLRFDFRSEAGRATRVSQLEQARAAMARHLAEGRREYTAVVANNDPVALGVVGALVEAGVRVPREVSVVGFDDVEAAFCIPGLTTVSHRLADMGRRAAELVMEMVTDGAARERLRGRREVLRPELVMRESTAIAAAVGR
jgi:LacI family transcriptional regulator